MRKDRYLVGYGGTGNVVYGKYNLGVGRAILETAGRDDYAHPMTEYQAKRGLRKMPCRGAKIFKLVEVKIYNSNGRRR